VARAELEPDGESDRARHGGVRVIELVQEGMRVASVAPCTPPLWRNPGLRACARRVTL
jgi:hypothetical protein